MKTEEREIRRKRRVLEHELRAVMLPRRAATLVFRGLHFTVGVTRTRSTVRKGFGVRSRLPNRIRIKRRMRLSKRYCIYGENITSDQSGSCGTWRATIRCASPMPPFTESSNGTVSVDCLARWGVKRCIRNATTSGGTGPHIQMDVKFLIFKSKAGKKIKRYQYTAIDDATRVRALKIYTRHTQKNAIAFVDHIVAKFAFRIQQIRTDRGHEFQAQFHGHMTLKIWVSDMRISKRGHLNSTARSSALTAQTRKRSINC